jgi:hypothetical protein
VPGPRQQAQVLGQHAWNPNIKKKKKIEWHVVYSLKNILLYATFDK